MASPEGCFDSIAVQVAVCQVHAPCSVRQPRRALNIPCRSRVGRTGCLGPGAGGPHAFCCVSSKPDFELRGPRAGPSACRGETASKLTCVLQEARLGHVRLYEGGGVLQGRSGSGGHGR